MRTDDDLPTVALSDYLGVVVRRWRVVVVGALLGATAAAGYLALAPTTATATSVVNIAAITSDPYSASRSASGLVDMQTEAASVQSMAVAERAAGLLGDGTEPRDIRGRLSVSAIDSTTIMRISVTSLSAARAQAQADAVADAFLEYRSEQATKRITSVLLQDQSRLEALREQLSEANERLLAAEAGSLDAVQAETDRQLLTLQVNAVLDRTSSFEGVDTSGGQVLTRAADNALAYAPDRVMVGGGAVLVGAALGLVGAFVRQARDRRVHVGVDVVAAGAGPVVARLTGPVDPRSAHDLDQLRIVREWVLSSPTLPDGQGTLAFLEDPSTAGAWDVTADLARTLAEAEHPVRVIVVPTADGYTEELVQRLGLDFAAADDHGLIRGRLRPLSVWVPPSTSWVGATRHHVAACEDALVLLVCPAGATDADRMAVARLAGSALVFAAERVSQRAGLTALTTVAAAMDCTVLGAVTSVRGHRKPHHRSRTHRHAAAAPASTPDARPAVAFAPVSAERSPTDGPLAPVAQDVDLPEVPPQADASHHHDGPSEHDGPHQHDGAPEHDDTPEHDGLEERDEPDGPRGRDARGESAGLDDGDAADARADDEKREHAPVTTA